MLLVRRRCAALGIIWCVFAMGVPACAQGYVNVLTAERASSLSGIVVDMTGVPVADVAVAECAPDFKDCFTVDHSDKGGHLSVHSTRAGKVHYLQFLSPGMDPACVTVTLSPFRGKLKVRLQVGQ